MGHVPAGPLPEAGSGAHLPRSQHRRGRASRVAAARRRLRLAAFGEATAARFLERRRARVLGRNLRVGPDEVDLLVRLGASVVAVEVKTRIGGDPVELFTPGKAARLRRAAARLGAGRCDLIAVRVDRRGAAVRWLQGVC